MKKISLVLFAGMCILLSAQFCNAQLSVFGYYDFDDVVGWKVGANNSGCQRARAAEEDYYRRGGKQIGLQRFSGVQQQCGDNQYGCYALVKGFNTNPSTNVKRAVYSFISGGADTKEEAERRATDGAVYNVPGADRGTISVLTSGCIAKPSSPSQPANPSANWSGWVTGGDCFRKVSYRYMSRELVDLNYQFHYYFEARNDYPETIFFILSLKDATGKERFGTRHTIAPGQTIKFAEKMDKNYIKTFAIEKVRFKRDTGDYAACDDERNSSKNTTPSSKPAPAKDTTAPKQIDVSPASGPANNAAAIKPPASSPSSANGCIWQSESGGDPFKLKKGDDGVYRTTINGSFGGSPTYPSAGNGTYQARTGHNPLFLSFMNNKRFGFSGPGIPLYDFSNCISGFENADVWVNVKGNYEVKLLETEGGVLFNGSGNIILYQTIAKDTYQTSDRPCTPDCYKTVIRITGKDTLSVDYTNLQGQINQTDDFVKKKKSPLAGQTSTTTANTSLIGAGEKPVVNGGATGEVNDKSLASIEGEYEGEGVFSNDKYKITLTSYGIAETNLIKNTDTVWPYKKISSDTYNLTMPQYGADATWTIKQIDNNTYQKFMRNDPTPYLYRRISPTPQGGTTGSTVAVRPVSLAGLWDGDNGGTGIITMTENGFDWKNQGQGFSSSFKKIASDSYRFDDGKNYCIVKFISDTKLDYACNGSHYAYFTRRK